MAAKINHTRGDIVGSCTFVEEVTPINKHRFGKFVCACGNEFIAEISSVRIEHTTSCGCGIIRGQRQSKPLTRRFRSEYTTWVHIKMRCYNEKSKDYKWYGGRGIKMSNAWLNSFDQFLIDMGPRPSNKHSIDRIDVNGDYENGNCRWATQEEQARNRRDNRWLTHNGETMLLKDWADRLNVSHATIINRIERGMPMDRVLSKERYKNGKLLPHKVSLVLNWM